MTEVAELDVIAFNLAVSPLLRLVIHLTGFETAFITEIDLTAGRQRIVLAENHGRLQLAAGAEVDLSDSMCQLMFSQQLTTTAELSQLFPDSKGVQLGMQSFVVLPITIGDKMIGTLCGADVSPKTLTPAQHNSLQLISEALSSQLQALLNARQHRLEAQQAQRKVTKLQSKVEDLAELANTDPLTELLNRRGFQLRSAEAAQLCSRSGLLLSIMMIDIDHFKGFNDTHGHEQGDDMIKLVAEGLRRVARTTDVLCRLGGDEFILAAVDTNAAGMTALAERLLHDVRQQSKQLGLPCTLSIGIACGQPDDVELLMKEADMALYQSKDAGRNAVSVYAE
ncbi:GGDEF domain-containing protein [Arsukibacterium sp.]|uniref:GGDEF domain-containing protein n=1 Tax=Arsukibacterium sp. TaxID=1977258 RepID=UPI002FDB2E41